MKKSMRYEFVETREQNWPVIWNGMNWRDVWLFQLQLQSRWHHRSMVQIRFECNMTIFNALRMLISLYYMDMVIGGKWQLTSRRVSQVGE
jgi:hypothetical protein